MDAHFGLLNLRARPPQLDSAPTKTRKSELQLPSAFWYRVELPVSDFAFYLRSLEISVGGRLRHFSRAIDHAFGICVMGLFWVIVVSILQKKKKCSSRKVLQIAQLSWKETWKLLVFRNAPRLWHNVRYSVPWQTYECDFNFSSMMERPTTISNSSLL